MHPVKYESVSPTQVDPSTAAQFRASGDRPGGPCRNPLIGGCASTAVNAEGRQGPPAPSTGSSGDKRSSPSAKPPVTTSTTGRPRAAPGQKQPQTASALVPLPRPAALTPFDKPGLPGEGAWHAAGRLVRGVPAVYETMLRPPGSSLEAGIAWMDTRLLYAKLYSGTESPGPGPWQLSSAHKPSGVADPRSRVQRGFQTPRQPGRLLLRGAAGIPITIGRCVTRHLSERRGHLRPVGPRCGDEFAGRRRPPEPHPPGGRRSACARPEPV